MAISITSGNTGFVIPVRVTPKGSRDEVLPIKDGDEWLSVKVTALPEDGKANAAVVALLAKVFGISKSRVSIVRGETSRLKHVVVETDSLTEVLEKLIRYWTKKQDSQPMDWESCFIIQQE